MIMPRKQSFFGPPIRWDLIARVRREIQQGTYETPEKLAIALERLFASLGESADLSSSRDPEDPLR